MTLEDLLSILNGYDKTMTVKLRISDADEDLGPDADGTYLDITADNNITVEAGDLIIIGDLPPE